MNDFTNSTGEIVCPNPENCTLETIHYDFGETCKSSKAIYWKVLLRLYDTISDAELIGFI